MKILADWYLFSVLHKGNKHSEKIFSIEIFISELILTCSFEVTLLIRLKVEWPYSQMENGSILWESFPEIFYVMICPNFGCVKKIASSSTLKNSHQNSLSHCFTAVLCLTPVTFNLVTLGVVKFQWKNLELSFWIAWGFLFTNTSYVVSCFSVLKHRYSFNFC